MKASIENSAQWVKKHPIQTIFLSALFIGGFSVYSAYFGNPLKVTNPDSSFFNPMRFNFEDYLPADRNDVIVKMFPMGINREYVRKVMDASNATEKGRNSLGRDNVDFYQYSPQDGLERSFQYFFVFDAQQKLIRISCSVNESCILNDVNNTSTR